MKDGAHQLEIYRKDVIEVLSIELEGVDDISSLCRINSRVTIESRYGPKGLFFRYLTNYFSVTFDRHATRKYEIDGIRGLALTEDRFPGFEMDLLGQSSDAAEFLYGGVTEKIH